MTWYFSCSGDDDIWRTDPHLTTLRTPSIEDAAVQLNRENSARPRGRRSELFVLGNRIYEISPVCDVAVYSEWKEEE